MDTENQTLESNEITKTASFTLEGMDFRCYLVEPSGEILYNNPEETDELIDCYQLADLLMSTIYSSDEYEEGSHRIEMITTLVTMQLDSLAHAVLDTVD